jgi:hypothetical protein
MTFKIYQSSTNSHIPDVIDGLSHEEAGDLLSGLALAGGISEDDQILETSGTANHLRRTSTNLREVVNNLPVILDRTFDRKLNGLKEDQAAHQKVLTASADDVKHLVTKGVDDVKNLVDEHIKTIKRNRPTTESKLPDWIQSIEWKSLSIGFLAATMASLTLAQFVILPAQIKIQVQKERGGDWAIAQWLDTAQGRKMRKIFTDYCKSKYPCKKLDKAS